MQSVSIFIVSWHHIPYNDNRRAIYALHYMLAVEQMIQEGTRLLLVRSLTGRFICIGDVEFVYKTFALTKDQLDKIPSDIRKKGESVIFTKGNTISLRYADVFSLWQLAKEIEP